MTFQWLVGVSSLCVLIGSALLLWGLKVVPVSNPFASLMRDSATGSEIHRAEREHPWAVAAGVVLCIVGLTLLMVAGLARRP